MERELEHIDERRQALADFLRTRRARVTPSQVGLPAGPRRRTPGLRREEVAQIANVGITWYTWLEQGRDIHVSADVLAGIAEALQLTPDERQHLFLLAEQPVPAATASDQETISPALQRMLDSLDITPAFVIGRRMDRVAWNTAARAVFGDIATQSGFERNVVWQIMTGKDRYRFVGPWEEKAQRMVAEFRGEYGRHIGDPDFLSLIAELERVSPEFRAWWTRYDLRGPTDGRKDLMHPQVGRLALEHITLRVPENPDLKVMIYTPIDEDDTLAKLRRLIEEFKLAQLADASARI